MSISKRGDRYHVQVDFGYKLNGKRDRRTRVCKTKKEAQRAERELMLEASVRKGQSDRITLKAFVDEYWWPQKEATLRATTLKGYERDLRLRILPAMGSMRIPDIKKMHVQQMCSTCATWKVAKNARDTLRAILAEAVDMGVISRNPAAGRIRLPERKVLPDQHNGAWLTSFSEHRDFLAAIAGHPAEPIAVLGLCFGLRKGEILGLNWEDLDFKARVLHVRRTYTFAKGTPELTPPKTLASIRTIPMTTYAREYLYRLQRKGGVTRLTGPVVVGRDGSRMAPQTAYGRVKSFTDTHDVLPVTILTMRHSFATACVRAGVPVADLSKWLGHTDVTTTLNRYVRPMMDDLSESAAIIDEAFGT